MTCNKNCFFWLELHWTPESRPPLTLLHRWQLSDFSLSTGQQCKHCQYSMYLDCSLLWYIEGCEKLYGVLWHKVTQLLLSCRRVEDNSSRMICWVVVKHFDHGWGEERDRVKEHRTNQDLWHALSSVECHRSLNVCIITAVSSQNSSDKCRSSWWSSLGWNSVSCCWMQRMMSSLTVFRHMKL